MNIMETWLVNMPIAKNGLTSDMVPETSEFAIQNAIKNNYAIYITLRRTLDGVVVAFTDNTLSRLTKKDGYIANMNYEDIKDLKLLKTDCTILTLEKVLEIVDGNVPILFELKSNNDLPIENLVFEQLKSYKGEFAICSYNPNIILWFKLNAPTFKRGIVSSFFKHVDLPKLQKNYYKKMKGNKISDPNFIVYDANNIPNRFVKKFKHLPLIGLDVDSLEKYDKVLKYCDNIIFEKIRPNM